MRVISGQYRGRVLKGFELKGTRPTMDRVKESLFAMLQPYLEGSCCLDLFAGSGNLGIEALSEGARQVVFVDHNKEACQTVKENLKSLTIDSKGTVIREDYQKALASFSSASFDLIFLDPPYQTDYLSKALKNIACYQLLKDRGMIVLESDDLKKMNFDSTYYSLWKEKKYGDKYIRILQKK